MFAAVEFDARRQKSPAGLCFHPEGQSQNPIVVGVGTPQSRCQQRHPGNTQPLLQMQSPVVSLMSPGEQMLAAANTVNDSSATQWSIAIDTIA